MKQFYEIKTYKQYDRDVKLPCLPTFTTTCSVATIRATGSATSVPTGCCFTKRILKYASSRSTVLAPMPTFSAKERNGSQKIRGTGL